MASGRYGGFSSGPSSVPMSPGGGVGGKREESNGMGPGEITMGVTDPETLYTKQNAIGELRFLGKIDDVGCEESLR